jgi:hypothetical protein
MDEGLREVRYDLYCKNCKHEKVKDNDEPCEECLTESARLYSERPVNFEEK